MAPTRKPPARVTPLVIVAAFVSLTEVALAYALTKTTGWPQGILTVFVIIFAIGVAAAFFYVLWHRPYVFYAPSEYGGVDPKSYIETIRQISPQVAALAATAEANPQDEDAKFSLIDAMSEPAASQFVILMFESKVEIGNYESYVYQQDGGGAGSGSGFNSKNNLQAAGIFQPRGGGAFLGLTEEGERYAKWLLMKGRKFAFFRTKLGGWGAVKKASGSEWLREEEQKILNPSSTA